jgi:uncharacterized membrane protein YsdA (DUF1294 family)
MKKLKKEKGISISRGFVYIWLATIISFIFTLDPKAPSNNDYSIFLAGLFLFNIGLGFAAFILANLPFKFFHKTLNKKFSSTMPIIAIAYFLIYVFSLSFQNHGIIASQFRASPTPITIPTFSMPTDTPTPSPTPVYIPQYIAPTVDPDPPVLCNVSPNCGGGTTPLRQSECNNSTCCQIGDKWIFYKDKVQCGRDQGAQSSRSNSIPQNAQQSQGNNFYCWDNAYGYSYYTSSGDQCNLDNIKSTTYKICNDTQKMKVNTCDSSCSGQPVGINGAEDFYAECLGKCSDQYVIDLTQCHL